MMNERQISSISAKVHKIVTRHNIFLCCLILGFLFLGNTYLSHFGGSGLLLPNNILFWLAMVPPIFIGPLLIAKNKTFIYNNNLLVVLALILIMSMPILWADSMIRALPKVLGLWLATLFLISLIQLKPKTSTVLFVVVLSGLINAVFGLLQNYFPEVLTLLFQTVSLNDRATGSFWQPNVLGSFLATTLIVSLWLSARNLQKHQLWIIYLFTLISPTVLLLAQSRTGYVGLFFGFLLAIHYLARNFSDPNVKKWIICFATGFSIGFIILVTEGVGGNLARDADNLLSVGMRRYDFEHTLWMIAQKPWFGWGYGDFQGDFFHSWGELRNQGLGVSQVSSGLDHPHNEFLYWSVEGGLFVGGALVITIIYLLVTQLKNNYSKDLVKLAMLVPIALHVMLENPFYASTMVLFTFVILVWNLFFTSNIKSYSHDKLSNLSAPVILVASLTFLSFVTAFHSFIIYKNMVVNNSEIVNDMKRIINPFSHTRNIEYYIILNDLFNSRALDITPVTEIALYNAEQYISNYPYPNIYQEMILAYDAIGKNEDADRLFKEAKMHFQTIPPFIESNDYSDLLPATSGDPAENQ